MRKRPIKNEDTSSKIVVLYVDDEQYNLNAFYAHFRTNRDLIILTARSGEEGLEVLKVVNAHIIIADQRMPNMTGVEFMEEARQKSEPVKIVVTAHRDISAIEKAYKEGKIFKFHDKPWDLNDLENSLREAISQIKKSNTNFLRLDTRK